MLARFARRFFRFDGIFGFFLVARVLDASDWVVNIWTLFWGQKKSNSELGSSTLDSKPSSKRHNYRSALFLFAVKKNTGFWTTPERYHHYGLNCHAYPCFYKTLFISSAKENHRVEHYTNFLHYQFISQENYSNVG